MSGSGAEAPGPSTGDSRTRSNPAYSTIRVGTSGWEVSRGSAAASSAAGLNTLRTTGSVGRPDSTQDPAWVRQPIHVALPPAYLDKRARQQIFAERVREIGLEPNRSAYKSRISSLDPEARRMSWVRKIFGEKPSKSTHPPKSELRPCKAKECRPVPVPPKPCVGSKCPKEPPTSTKAVCTNGFPAANGSCQPWGYMENCSYPYTASSLGQCRVHWASVDSSYCWQISQELGRQQRLLEQTRVAQDTACATASQSLECVQLTQRLNDELARIQQLQQQYRMCAVAVRGYLPLGNAWSFTSWPSVLWP